MRTAAAFLQGHIDGLRADIEHVAAGALRTDWTPAQRDKIQLNERVIAVLEQVAHDRLADVDEEVARAFGPAMEAARRDAWWAGHRAGVDQAVRVVEAHTTDARRWGRGRVQLIFDGLVRLQSNSAARRG